MDGGLVFSAGLRVAATDRHMDCSADLLVEQDLAGAAVDPVIGPDSKLTQTSGAWVGVEKLNQELLSALGASIYDEPRFEVKPHPGDLAAADHRRQVKAHLALGRILNRAGEELSVGHVVTTVAGNELPASRYQA